jgi:hypothetical protein
VSFEIIRDQMSPLARQLTHRARAVINAGAPAETSRRIAYDVAIVHAAVADLMAHMPNAEGLGLLVNNFQMLADRYQRMGATLPSTGEH